MDVSLIRPIEEAWGRTRRVLFAAPFDLERWLVVGFAAWIARLGDNGLGLWFRRGLDLPDDAGAELGRLLSHPVWLVLGALGLLVALAIGIAVLWVSSRGRFVFLDDVLHDRRAIVEPWKRFAREGNSLFLWRLGFAFATLAALAVLALPWLLAVAVSDRSGSFVPGLAGFMVLPLVLAVAVVAAFVVGLLENFVVPLQYRYGGTTTEAWRLFLPLLGAHLGTFVLWGVLWAGILLVIGIAIWILGLLTCCLGFVVLMVPYVNAVVLLPVSYTLRGYGPALLAQFGEAFVVAPPQPT